MLTAVNYLGNVGIGVTAPLLIRANDRRIYVVKLQNNRLGAKVLVNELLAAKVAEYMELCFPPSDIITIDEELLQNNQRLAETGATPGQHFASLFINRGEYLTKRNLHKAVNTSEMAGVVLFDHIFHNGDRTTNGKNLLLRKENDGHKIYAIDNSHLFRSGRWTKESLVKLKDLIRIYYRFSYGKLLKDFLIPQDFIPFSEKINNITAEQVNAIVGNIPYDWLPDDLDRLALVNFILARQALTSKIIAEICNHIPKARGGRQWWGGKGKLSENKLNWPPNPQESTATFSG